MTKLTGSPTYGYWKFLARSDLEDVLKPEGRVRVAIILSLTLCLGEMAGDD